MAHQIITVNRQFGSGGRAIAMQAAEKLGISFYDRDLLKMAAERSEIQRAQLEEADEKTIKTWLYSRLTDQSQKDYPHYMPVNDVLFTVEKEIIRELAGKESCIIVGRCADYILRKHTNVLNVLIHAPMDFRVHNVMERLSLEEKEAAALTRKMDKQRRYYYNYYTDRKWGEMENYHLILDSSYWGIEGAADMLASLYGKKK